MRDDLTQEISMLCQGKATEGEINRIFKDLYPRILRFFCNKGLNRAEAEDHSQEALHRIFRQASSCRDVSRFRSWAFAVSANVYRNEIRHWMSSKRRSPEVSLENERHENILEIRDSRAISPEEHLVEQELLQRLKKQIEKLPPQQQNVLRLSLHGRSLREIAKLLDISIGTVKAHLYQARQALRRRLTEPARKPEEDLLGRE